MRPIIGISGDLKSDPVAHVRLKLGYVDAVRRAGGIPVILPPLTPGDELELLRRVDGIVLSGGDDIDPRPLGGELHEQASPMHPRRQEGELALALAVLAHRVPTLGVCLGMQVLTVAAGGALHQHLPDAGYPNLLDHRAEHEVELMPGSRLQQIVGATRLRIVSHHHQGVARVPALLREVARSDDGVIEGLEAVDGRFLVAVQWHPERSPEAPDTERLFRALVEAAARA